MLRSQAGLALLVLFSLGSTCQAIAESIKDLMVQQALVNRTRAGLVALQAMKATLDGL